jgi:uncharacterized circularly permuted ATP-grasp superfamily protein/uncharacterized alpha-E superfamily protein
MMSQSQSQSSSDPQLFRGYGPAAGAFDELRDANGVLRPAWAALAPHIGRIGLGELSRREQSALRQLQENGSTFTVHGDRHGGEHPWELDALPFVMGAGEWEKLSSGLAQRARLLDAILADLFGPQRCIREGWIPPAVVFDNPSFLFACHGLLPPGGVHLHFYAADLARAPDGNWRVIADLAQSPAGAGYVLENRIVLSRLMPELYRDCQVLRLARFFQTFRETLYRIAPRHRDNPRIVMLSPGPKDETYFEHAFLARYLGHSLVEAEDLAVRENAVFLKMLGGLQPVDVIVRRVADSACDGLELPGGAGVPGLLNAARQGQIALANTIGSGILESPAMLAFLPDLCAKLLGEELLLPSVATYWLGDPAARERVFADRERYSIVPAFGPVHQSGRFSRSSGDTAHDEPADEKILREPSRYVAQEIVRLSCSPSLEGDHIAARPTFLRTYAAASENGYAVMPGGLARALDLHDHPGALFHRGGVSKDVWILSDAPVSPFSLLSPAGAPIELSRGGGDLPSRVADNLYWLGRYVERADYLIRIARVVLIKLSDRPDNASMQRLAPLLALMSCPPVAEGEGLDFEQVEHDVFHVLFEPTCAGGLRQTIDEVCRVASLARDRISADTWRILNRIDISLQGMARIRPTTLGDVIELLNHLIIRIAGVAGLSMESMTRGHGWRFLEMGRRIERAMQTITLVEKMLIAVDENEAQTLDDILQIADSAITYRRRYLASLQAAPVLDLLLTDDSNPRSLAFQITSLVNEIGWLPRDFGQIGLTEEQRIAVQMQTAINLSDIVKLASDLKDGKREALAQLLHSLEELLPALSDVISRHYLSHARSTRQLENIRNSAHDLPRPPSNNLSLQ